MAGWRQGFRKGKRMDGVKRNPFFAGQKKVIPEIGLWGFTVVVEFRANNFFTRNSRCP
jgi:hypothetical protein